MQLNSFISAFPKGKKGFIIIGLLVFGILLSIVFSSFGGGEVKEESLEEYKIRMEKELTKLCSSIDGVGKCTVNLSFSSGTESVYKSGKLIGVKPPKVLGAVITCRGANSSRVRKDITELFTSLFDIPTNRIAVLKLN